MRPLYEQLKRQHYSSNDMRAGFVDSDPLFSEIGYDFKALLRQGDQYENTCAVRMSLALLKCNIEFSGRFTIRKGPLKGKKFEMGAKLLADQLNKPHIFGSAEIYTDKVEGGRALLKRRGVVFLIELMVMAVGILICLSP
ncbi:T6SS effector amidase Tae4 family protein [Kosakonia cowanii]|uniref:T6SS effector amidase Tae4 family protein n=1 Tax=Kosakonia cowanii TaxID=208223 RepID=UPI001CEF5F89|nr:T6SS effector amidase Tae4 family protein [Kosakonia cowanii]